jgi:hypothetical protein
LHYFVLDQSPLSLICENSLSSAKKERYNVIISLEKNAIRQPHSRLAGLIRAPTRHDSLSNQQKIDKSNKQPKHEEPEEPPCVRS